MNIKTRFRGTYLGLVWTAFEPMLLFAFLYILFTSISITTKEDFAIYLLIGIVIYHAFTKGSQSGLGSLRDNYTILSSVNIRRELFPVVTTATASLLLFVEIGVFFGLMPFAEFVPSLTIALLPLVLGLLLLLILGISYFLSITYAYAKDIQPLWGVFVSALFFITPIFWYIDDANGIVLEVQRLNPLGQLIEIAHKLVFGQIPPIADWLYTAGIIFGILLVGYVIFQKGQKNIVERI